MYDWPLPNIKRQLTFWHSRRSLEKKILPSDSALALPLRSFTSILFEGIKVMGGCAGCAGSTKRKGCEGFTSHSVFIPIDTNTPFEKGNFTHRRFHSQTLLHTDAFTHTAAFTHRRFYTQTQFLMSESHFVRKGRAGPLKVIIFPHFLTIELHFTHEAHSRPVKIAIFPHFLTIELRFARKGAPSKSQFFLSSERLNLIWRVRVTADASKSQFFRIFRQYLTIAPHFVRNCCVS
jgi:hypothetical protein